MNMSSRERKRKETKEEFSKEEIIDLVEMFRYLLDAYGFFAEKLGRIQKDHEEAYKFMFSLELAEKLPEMLSLVSEKGPPELSKLLTRMFVKMSAFLPRIGKLMDLSADEKIKLGKNLKSLAKDFDKLLNWIERMEEK
jgi:hypothetical protein